MSNPQVVSLNPDAAVAAVPEGGGRGAAAQRRPAPALAPAHSAFVPVLLCALTLLAWFAFQAVLLLGERSAMQAARDSQQQTVDNAAKLRSSLDGLAADTQRLANAGNPSASVLVTELRKRGITISVPPADAAAAAAAPASR